MQNKDFFQEEATISNTFQSDTLLKDYINKVIPDTYKKEVIADLNSVGEKASGEWFKWSQIAENIKPVLTQYDSQGRRIDHIETSREWKNLEAAASSEGIVATAYERKHQEFSRIYQMAKLYLYSPSSAFVGCPLAMTDGAARAIELHGDDHLKATALKHLTSRDPKTFWTAGQWMTEKTGGSDVSGTSTVAKSIGGNQYELSGTKWFTSATTSPMALTLARIEGDSNVKSGLSLFYLEVPNNKIEVHRLKGKLGTDALPTAELSLYGTKATLMGGPNEGVKRIASVLNVTRIYSAIGALAHMRRCIDLATNYATKRKAFGDYLINMPLHKKTLQDLEIEFAKCFKLTFLVIELLGKEETNKATDTEKKLLRALTPIVKLYTAKKCVVIASECLECFGGAGYIENTGIARLYRDAQVFAIWEGTTNILALIF
ncbi:MAG: acyl-CoA dehydrogenase family protein [Bdellovibrionota bacterium]